MKQPQPSRDDHPAAAPEEWNELWTSVHETLYETTFQEFVLESLVARWERAALISKFVITVTAPGSAISGWALWNTDAFKYLWAIVAGLGAIFVVAEAILHVNERIKENTLLMIEFRSLRTDIETFQKVMRINSLPGLQAYKDSFLNLRERYSKATSKRRPDLWHTTHVNNTAQGRLDQIFQR